MESALRDENSYRIGVDVGGTFTDLVLADAKGGTARYLKVPTTSIDPSVGILNGIRRLIDSHSIRTDQIAYIAHGTTVGTNILLERKGARTALVTTKGFEDLLAIGRQTRPKLYDFSAHNPPPLVPGELRFGVVERIVTCGVLIPLEDREIDRIADLVATSGAESLAICFLHAYRDPSHEARLAAAVRVSLPDVHVYASHEVLPEIREFERTSTTVASAYLGPPLRRYLGELVDGLVALGIEGSPFISQSNGGVVSVANLLRAPVNAVLSGPSSGVVAGHRLAKVLDVERLLTFDMGGTSTDVSRIDGGELGLGRDRKIGGVALRCHSLDIHTVGAGGGSIAWVDSGLALQVGPLSAGSDPGPALYGRGGKDPTVTDANAVLGRLPAQHLLGGDMKLDLEGARSAISGLATTLGCDSDAAAAAIVKVANSRMAAALRVVSIERGYDPRDYALMAYGGAGPLHAAELADELGISQVLIPNHPGLLCALGLLAEPVRLDLSRTVLHELGGDDEGEIVAAYLELRAEVNRWLEDQGAPGSDCQAQLWAEMRYRGQNHELRVVVEDTGLQVSESLRRRFDAIHQRQHGYSAASEAIELVNVGVTGTWKPHTDVSSPEYEVASGTARAALVGSRQAYFHSVPGFVDCAIFDRARLGMGSAVSGPALIEEMDSTTLLPPGWRATVGPVATLLLSRVV